MSSQYGIRASMSAWGRSTKLLATTTGWAILLILTDWFFGSPVLNGIFYTPPTDQSTNARGWNALIYASIFTVSLPAVLMTWHWRDQNTQDKISNDRRDTTLKEFQEVQRNAAGIFAKDVPSESLSQLQSAALRQLGDFLRGTYGDTFRRPAFEILMAGHHAAVQRSQVADLIENIRKKGTRRSPEDIFSEANRTFSQVDRTRVSILQDTMIDWLNSDFDLSNRSFDFLNISGNFLINLEIKNSSFYFSNFQKVNVSGCKISGCRFYYNDFREAYFRDTTTLGCRFEKSILPNSTFIDSGPEVFDQFYFGSAIVGGRAHELDGVRISDESQLSTRWDRLSDETKSKALASFNAAGGRFYLEPPYIATLQESISS